jgi:hypothetical protein
MSVYVFSHSVYWRKKNFTKPINSTKYFLQKAQDAAGGFVVMYNCTIQNNTFAA